MYNSKNYKEQGGDRTVIGGELVVDGKLTVSDAAAVVGMAQVRQYKWTAAQAVATDADGVVDGAAGPADTLDGEGATVPGVPLVIVPADVAFLAQPPCARNLVVVVAATTVADIAAGKVVIAGKDARGAAISEEFTVTAATAGTLTGSKAFAEITSITIPVQTGASVTFDVGWGDKLGLPIKLANGVHHIATYLGASAEATAPTFATSGTVLSDNTIDLNSALSGSAVEALFIVR
jgi:hypothetical protein